MFEILCNFFNFKLRLELAYNLKFEKYTFGMRRIPKLVGKILAGPMLVMHAVSPESGGSEVIDDALVGTPNLIFVLAIA
jgi:hypothetical protein